MRENPSKMEPLRPAGSPRRRGTPPSLLGASSGSAFPAAADGDDEGAVSEHPCVTLSEWWLATVEGEDQKIAVAGTFLRNEIPQKYPPSPIAKCLTPTVLQTEDGTILRIDAPRSHKTAQSYENGYSLEVCEKFVNEFPDWWEDCKLRYPKPTDSSNASNSGEDSTQFYLKAYDLGRRFETFVSTNRIWEHVLHNDAVFQKSSHLLNAKPRIEEYTCDGDIATDENAAASSKAATGDQRTPVVSLEVRGCRKETQHMSFTEKTAVDDDMPTSVDLDTHNSLCLSNGTQLLEEYTCNGDIPTNGDAAASNDDNERYTATSKEVNNMEIVLVTSRPSRERGHDDIATDVSLAPAVERTNNAVSESVHSTPATGTYRKRKRTPVAYLKSQGSWRQNQRIASKKKPVDRPQKQISPQEKCQGAARFPVTMNSVSYPVVRPQKQISPQENCQGAARFPVTTNSVSYVKDPAWSITAVEALNLKRSRSGRLIVPKLNEGCQNIAYGSDGSITGVIGLASPGVFKWCCGSGSKPRERKKKRKTIGIFRS